MFVVYCLCVIFSELIEKVQTELCDLDLYDAVSDMFQGQLVSQVRGLLKKCLIVFYFSIK